MDDLNFSSPEAWRARAIELFGDDQMGWTFECPVCKHIATVRDWKDAGAPQGAVAFSCVGRWRMAGEFKGGGKGPCNYSGGGPFKLNPVSVEGIDDRTFAFAGPEEKGELMEIDKTPQALSVVMDQLFDAKEHIAALESEAIRLDEARHATDLAQKAQISDLTRQLSDSKADLDDAAVEGNAARVSDKDIRELCGPPGEGSTLELVRSLITHLETEIGVWKLGSQVEAREADSGRTQVAELRAAAAESN